MFSKVGRGRSSAINVTQQICSNFVFLLLYSMHPNTPLRSMQVSHGSAGDKYSLETADHNLSRDRPRADQQLMKNPTSALNNCNINAVSRG